MQSDAAEGSVGAEDGASPDQADTPLRESRQTAPSPHDEVMMQSYAAERGVGEATAAGDAGDASQRSVAT